MRSAHFSPIMMLGALVLPPIRVVLGVGAVANVLRHGGGVAGLYRVEHLAAHAGKGVGFHDALLHQAALDQ